MRCCERLRKLINRKSTIVFVMVAVSFFSLFHYRSNPKALKIGATAPDIALESMDGEKLNLYDIKKPVMLVFFNTNTFLSGGMYTQLFLKNMPYLKSIDKINKARLIIITDGDQRKAIIREKLSDSRYKILENNVYSSNNKQAQTEYGLSIWPHFFLIDSNKQIIYAAKVPSVEIVDGILDRSQ
ncbi:peroxiredoxin [Seleniivibrio woodruffii]|uniref:peroxiredoxin family protein n=1 Tax=Seleniivibrio woodruffii TaxID=1078050 RepID=UPI0026F06E40|nr:redoxin domain-containing protein [Seleniivibrio woodruffii]